MSTLLTALIVMACIWAMLVATLLIVVRLRSRSSTTPSPTPSTTPTPISEEVVLKLMEATTKSFAEQMNQTRQMVVDLTLGRESPRQIGTPETWPMQNERPLDFDYDLTPLSPGIEAVLEREETETEQQRILREREELQSKLIEAQAELDRFTSEQSSQEGPWTNGDNPRHARTD